MIHDEKTTEIELPWATKSVSQSPSHSQPQAKALEATKATKEAALVRWTHELDMNSPWVLRLLAVIAILLLSLLVL